MSVPGVLYSKAWHGLRDSLRSMVKYQPGTPEHIAGTAKATVWMEVLLVIYPERTAASIMRTALEPLSDNECGVLQASV